MSQISVDEALLILKIAFIVLLYLFIWRIVRSASRDFRRGGSGGGAQESMIIAPGHAAHLGTTPRTQTRARLVVLKSPALAQGRRSPSIRRPSRSGAAARTTFRSTATSSPLRSTRFETRRDGLWVEDTGSTNGTFVNGARVTTPRRLGRGDVVRVGQTDFRVEL